MAVTLDTDRFARRLKAMYSSWQASAVPQHPPMPYHTSPNPDLTRAQEGGEDWAGATAIVAPAGSAVDSIRYSKTSSLFLWMLGYEFTGESRSAAPRRRDSPPY
jgi:nucleosome binding factor SPN SPT16 subunit